MHESGEMYLETILQLSSELDRVRAVDIVDRMSFSKASVSRALAKLKNDGYVDVDRIGIIELTDKGRAVAEKILERHELLSKAIMALGVSEQAAMADACKIEHDISDETFEAIKLHMKKNL